VDAMLDGFLIGITASINAKAGIILGLANCIEMGFLGIALSIRIAKCTGSSIFMRMMSLVAPPLAMLFMAVLGGLAGASADDHPVVLVTIVCFGIVVLLALVCNELLVEAAEANENDVWWISIMTFIGVYAVILIDLVV
jgi:zinc transporter ZupT